MKTIMILENDSFKLDLSRWALKEYSIIPATFAIDGCFPANDQQIDLLIANVDYSGVLIALQMRSRMPDLQILFTSSHKSTMRLNSEIWGFPVGFIGELHRGLLSPTVLRNKVHELIGPPVTESPLTGNGQNC